jgi:3-oxoacyl-[acyl-carrier protein] reductase
MLKIMNISFYGKLVIISGANSGIGKEILHSFAANGAEIITITRSLSTEFIEECSELMKSNKITIRNIQLDFSNEADVDAVAKLLAQKERKIDVLINNAGIGDGGLFTQTRIQTIRSVFEVNFFAHLILTQYIIKNMIKNKSGSIINIGSTSGIRLRAGMAAYGSSKSALTFWGGVLAKEVGRFGIRVNTVAPGVTKTKMLNQMSSLFTDNLLRDTPLGSFAAPSDISNLVIFLASEYASHISGETIVCDGAEI